MVQPTSNVTEVNNVIDFTNVDIQVSEADIPDVDELCDENNWPDNVILQAV